jgi:polysaccharide export outer membrane protein
MNKLIGISILTLVSTYGLLANGQVNPEHENALPATKAGPDATGSRDAVAAPATPNDEFVIGVADVLAINVWKEADISRVLPVRSDGRVTLPLIGEIQARGLTAKQLEKEIATRLKEFVSDPEVTVIVQEIHSQNFNILGQVQHPGTFTLAHPVTILDAIALAGGFRDFAKTKSIYVLRQKPDGTTVRLPFNYKDTIKGNAPAQNIHMENGDTLFVP